MGVTYMIICLADFCVFPIMWNILQIVQHTTISEWQPITLSGSGLFHISMGAILGVSAYGRTQEKIANQSSPTNTTTT